MKRNVSKKKHWPVLPWLLIALVVLTVLAIGLGRYYISPADVVKILFSRIAPVTHTW